MPDIVLSNNGLPDQGNQGYLPPYQGANTGGVSAYDKAFADLGKLQKANANNALMNLPYETPLNQVLKYTDPNIGFNPLDKNLEYKYADAHPFKTFGNNLLQAGAKFLGAAVQTIGTIPLAIDAIANKDFSKLYDNDFSNGINEWLDGLQNSLPTYRTKYEDEHPILKYLTPWNLKSFAGAWGGQANNLGFMAGAIGGAFVEDAIITALTGGAGLLPALAGNAAQITKGLSRGAEVFVAAPEDALAVMRGTYRNAEGVFIAGSGEAEQLGLQTIRGVSKAEEFAGESAAIRAQGTGMSQEAIQSARLLDKENRYASKLDFWNKAYKIRDGVKYNLALLTSAASQGAFMASGTYVRGKQELAQQFYDIYGRAPQGKEIDTIDEQAKGAANFTMGANLALLYLGNRINWGSLFKPTGQAVNEVESGISGWGSSIERVTKTAKFKDVEGAGLGKEIEYSLISKAPETRIGKVLLNAEKLGAVQGKNAAMALQFGALYAASEGSLDYIKHKYDPNNLAQVGNFMKSFNTGLSNSFGTKEGWDNMVTGFIGGVAGGMFHNKMSGQPKIKERLKNEVSILNSEHFNGTLEANVREKAGQLGLSQEHKEAIDNGDIRRAKSKKFEMLYNWVSSGIRANSFEARLNELNMVRNLEGKSFTDFWKLEDTKQNRDVVNKFLDGINEKAQNIKGNVEKVQRLAINPFEKGTKDAHAYEVYKDQLALKLSSYEDGQRRMKSVRDDLKAALPLLDLDGAVKMTSVQGMSEILTKLQKTSDNIAMKIKSSEGNDELQKTFFEKKKQIDSLFGRLQKMVYSGETLKSGRVVNVDFNGKDYMSIMRDLYDLHNGIDFENNRFLDEQKRLSDGKELLIEDDNKHFSDDDLADHLEKLQDIYHLNQDGKDITKYYTYLRKGIGAKMFMDTFKNLVDANAAHVGKDGAIKTPEDIEAEIREDEYFNIERDEKDENVTPEERETLKKVAKKVVDDEDLTPEEEKLTEEKEHIFTKFVKTEKKIKEKVNEIISNLPKSNVEVTPKTTVPKNSIYQATEPNNLFGMYSEDKPDVKFRSNLYNAIFKSGESGIFSSIKAIFTKVDTEGKTKTFTRIGDSKIYRSSFDDNITLSHSGQEIGILRPADSLWLDSEGKRSIYDMTEEEYHNVTGNPRNTYAQFMAEIKAYKNAYNALKADMQNSSNTEDIEKRRQETLKGLNKTVRYKNGNVNVFERIEEDGSIQQDDIVDNLPIVLNGKIGTIKQDEKTGLWSWSIAPVGKSGMTKEELFDSLFANKIKKGKVVETIDYEQEADSSKEFTYEDIAKHFNISINVGSRVQNEFVIKQNPEGKFVVTSNEKEYGTFKTQEEAKEFTKRNNDILAKQDTLLRDLNYKPEGTVLISITDGKITTDTKNNEIATEGKEIKIVNQDELSGKQLKKALQFIKDNEEFLLKSGNRYVLALPIAEEYSKGALIFGRNAETIDAEKNSYYDDIVSVANGNVRDEAQAKLITAINKKFFLANADRTVGKTLITTSFDPEGNLIIKINNPSLKIYNEDIKINKADVIAAKNYESLINKIQGEINGSESKGLKQLKITLNKDSLKRQIPDDEKITKLKQLDEVMKFATTPNIFKNFGLNFKPKEVEGRGVNPNEKPTEIQPLLSDDLKNAKPRYGYKDKLFKLEFESDIDKAAYTTAQGVKNKRDADYVKFVMDHTGMTEAQVRALGQKIRDHIKGIAKNGEDGTTIHVTSIYEKPQEKQISKVTFVKDKEELTSLLKNIFKLTDEQSKRTATIFQNVAEAWAKRTGKEPEDFYKTLGFSDILEEANSSNTLKQLRSDIQNIASGFGLVPQYDGSLFVGYKSKNGRIGDALTNGLDEYIKKNNLNLKVVRERTYGTVFLEPKIEQGKLFQIIGEKGVSKLEDATNILNNLEVAKKMKVDLKDRSTIRQATGWEYNADGKWRYEIADDFKFDEKQFDNLRFQVDVKLGKLLKGSELLKLYPALADIEISRNNKNHDSSYNHSAKKISITGDHFKIDQTNTRKLTAESQEKIKSTLIHEIQHAIQNYEGFPTGGNVKVFERENAIIEGKIEGLTTLREEQIDKGNLEKADEIQKEINILLEQTSGDNSEYGKYKRVAGEVEARNAQTRMNYTDQERLSRTLHSTEDIEDASKIYLKSKLDVTNENLINRAKDLINEGVVKGYTAEVLKETANNNVDAFKHYLMNIADQANDPKSEKVAVETYGKDLIEVAKDFAKNNENLFISNEKGIISEDSFQEYLKANKLIEQNCE